MLDGGGSSKSRTTKTKPASQQKEISQDNVHIGKPIGPLFFLAMPCLSLLTSTSLKYRGGGATPHSNTAIKPDRFREVK